MLTHIVFFKLKNYSKENAEKLKEVLLSMKGKIPELRYIEAGTDVIRSERSYDVALITKFESVDALKSYKVHPVHKEVLEYISETVESTAAVDYISD
ncbi:Dabb family protein [Peptococcaceae bacterium]|jgi:hypothetical protein|nr:Dabb family protein [Desulfotomaculum sp.]MCL0051943.1 Dabb family protein [Peptococcaceae bacterium]MCL0067678.1 Dabb family protein [Peptococcaceae bacterium]MCL0077823.1 Dabb family protein [Peptococcaceae bacterium]MCL0100689.1 Dabb family protein [Peptococcaceae bacterium]